MSERVADTCCTHLLQWRPHGFKKLLTVILRDCYWKIQTFSNDYVELLKILFYNIDRIQKMTWNKKLIWTVFLIFCFINWIFNFVSVFSVEIIKLYFSTKQILIINSSKKDNRHIYTYIRLLILNQMLLNLPLKVIPLK